MGHRQEPPLTEKVLQTHQRLTDLQLGWLELDGLESCLVELPLRTIGRWRSFPAMESDLASRPLLQHMARSW